MTWGKVADILATRFRVICPDLPGFGKSYIPLDTHDHSGSSKRAKAQACVDLMRSMRHDRFAVVGHDRGSYTAFRLAMDHPSRVSHLAVLDGVPIIEALERADSRFASRWWNWFFFGIPEKPERAILADPDAWYGGDARQMGEEAFKDFRAAIHDPAVIHGMVEDYRAGLGVDRKHDADIAPKVGECYVRRYAYGQSLTTLPRYTATFSESGVFGRRTSRDTPSNRAIIWPRKRHRSLLGR